jgi:bifunctional ADP-heptose synthase (sugar kinase/adenylyltransferase)
VPVVRATHQSEQPGGAANVAMNLARLGAEVVLAGFAGDDENQRSLVNCLNKDGIRSMLVSCEGFPTITKLRILGGRQQMLRLDSEHLSSARVWIRTMTELLEIAAGGAAGLPCRGAFRLCQRVCSRRKSARR